MYDTFQNINNLEFSLSLLSFILFTITFIPGFNLSLLFIYLHLHVVLQIRISRIYNYNIHVKNYNIKIESNLSFHVIVAR